MNKTLDIFALIIALTLTMFFSVSLVISSPAKNCLCSTACVCGCNAGKPCTCQGAVPDTKKEEPKNFGMDASKIGKEPKYWINGKEVSRREAMAAVQKVPDDRHKLSLTIIGSVDDRKRVLQELDKLGELRALVVVQAYNPDDPMIKLFGFVTSGKPTIYLQRSDGVVLHRQDIFNEVEELATAIRKADPAYDPKKDPDLTKKPNPSPLSLPDLSKIPPAYVVIGIVIVIFLLQGKRQ